MRSRWYTKNLSSWARRQSRRGVSPSPTGAPGPPCLLAPSGCTHRGRRICWWISLPAVGRAPLSRKHTHHLPRRRRTAGFPARSACFFSRNNVFFSQQFNQNSVFQPVLAKIQQAKWGHAPAAPVVLEDGDALGFEVNATHCDEPS